MSLVNLDRLFLYRRILNIDEQVVVDYSVPYLRDPSKPIYYSFVSIHAPGFDLGDENNSEIDSLHNLNSGNKDRFEEALALWAEFVGFQYDDATDKVNYQAYLDAPGLEANWVRVVEYTKSSTAIFDSFVSPVYYPLPDNPRHKKYTYAEAYYQKGYLDDVGNYGSAGHHIALHEIGHILGLNDLEAPAKVKGGSYPRDSRQYTIMS